jgi:hypothetical protein
MVVISRSDGPAYREALEARIRAGGGDMGLENALAMLNKLDQRPPPKSPVEKRIEELEQLFKSSVIGDHAENAGAILEGYRSGTLEYIPGYYYIFKNGEKVAGPRPLEAYDPRKVLFEEFPNPKGIWVEEVSTP